MILQLPTSCFRNSACKNLDNGEKLEGRGVLTVQEQVIMVHALFCCCWRDSAWNQSLLMSLQRTSALCMSRHGTSSTPHVRSLLVTASTNLSEGWINERVTFVSFKEQDGKNTTVVCFYSRTPMGCVSTKQRFPTALAIESILSINQNWSSSLGSSNSIWVHVLLRISCQCTHCFVFLLKTYRGESLSLFP